MPSKQIKEFTAGTSLALGDLFIFQTSADPFTTKNVTLQALLASCGITLPVADPSTDFTLTIGAAKLLQFKQSDTSSDLPIILEAGGGSQDGDTWKLNISNVVADAAGVLTFQSYISGGYTDALKITSQASGDTSTVEVETDGILKSLRVEATSLNFDGGNIRYEADGAASPPSSGVESLYLDFNINLHMMGGVDTAATNYVRWDSDSNTLKFKGAPVSNAAPNPTTTHILMDEFSLLGLGGDNSDDGNYLTAAKTGAGDNSIVSGLLYSGTRAANSPLDFQIKNRHTGAAPAYGAASITMTMKASASAGDSVRMSQELVGSDADVPALVFRTDHNTKDAFTLTPTLILRGASALHSAQAGVMGSLNVSKEMRVYESGVNFPGHLTGDRAPGTNQGRYTGFKAPALGLIDDVASHVYEMPRALPGSNKVLQSTDAGIMSWITLPSTGTGTVEAGTQYKVAYYPNVDETLVNDTSALYWKSNRLGVNEAAPQTDVHLKSSVGPTIRLERNEPADIVDGDLLGAIEFYGFDDAAFNTFGVGAKIVGEASGAWIHSGEDSSLDTQTELQFWTTPNTGSLTNRLTIKDSGVIKYEKATHTNIESLTFNATLVVDLDTSNLHKITLTGNITTLTFTNSKVGQRFIVRVLQGGLGGYTIAWPSGVKWAGGGTAPTLTSTVDRATVLGFLTTGSGAYDGFLIGKDIPT